MTCMDDLKLEKLQRHEDINKLYTTMFNYTNLFNTLSLENVFNPKALV